MQTDQSIADYINSNHVKVVLIFNKSNPLGGVTIAYRPILFDSSGYPAGDFAWISFSFCKKSERYSRKYGEFCAVKRLQDNVQCVKLPIYRHKHPVRVIRAMIEAMENEFI